jgi:hypothetical protein
VTITAAIAEGVLDAELAGLLWLLAERGVPLVVASRSTASAAELRAVLTTQSGGVLLADSLEEVLRLSGAAAGGVPDELRELGVVVILRAVADRPRVVAAHYVRRLERDAAGHLQRRPPAILAAWDEAEGQLEHFAWGVTAELADHAGMPVAEFERSQRERSAYLDTLVGAGVVDDADVARAVQRFRLVGGPGTAGHTH